MTLRPCDVPYWDLIVRARARDEWEGPQIVVGIHLARCQADIESEQRLLDIEGSVIENARGTQVANPRAAILETLCRRQMALMRAMALNSTATTRAEDLKKKRGPEKTARQLAQEIADEEAGLLA